MAEPGSLSPDCNKAQSSGMTGYKYSVFRKTNHNYPLPLSSTTTPTSPPPPPRKSQKRILQRTSCKPQQIREYNTINLTNLPQIKSSGRKPDSINPSKKGRRREELTMEKADLSKEMRSVLLSRRIIRPKNKKQERFACE